MEICYSVAVKLSKNTQKQFIKFLIIGTANTALDFFIYVLLTRAFTYFEEHYLMAAAVAFLIAGANSYFWNKKWTFRDTRSVSYKQLVRFYMASGVGLFVNQFTLWTVVQLLTGSTIGEIRPEAVLGLESIHLLADYYDLIGKVIASGAAAGVNFVMQKLWTFKPEAVHTESAPEGQQ